MISERESRILYYMKAFAIISVVCAHISVVPENFSWISRFFCMILNEIGAIGVGVFFCTSGFIFRRKTPKEFSYKVFWTRKIQSIILPWIISAILVYLYVALRKGGSIVGGVLSVIGYKSSYWFLTVLIICYVLFCIVRKMKREDIGLCIMIFLPMISVLLRYNGIIGQDSLGVYLNAFNWTIFFAIGYVVAMLDKKYVVTFFQNRMIVFWSLVLSIGLLVLPYSLMESKFSYFCFWYIPAELVICYSIVAVSVLMAGKEIKIMMYLGKMSFSIYLYNELVWAGLVANLGNRIDFWPLLLVRPIIVITAVCCELMAGRWIFGLFKKEKLFEQLTGVRLK